MPRPISPRARKYVRAQATAIMEATCRIERVSAGSYDEDTLKQSAGARVTLYEGPCRLWESTGRAEVAIGDSELIMQSTNLSIPWDSAFEADVQHPAPRRDDQFVILSHHTDSAVVGRRGAILDVAKAGDLRATRRYGVQMSQSQSEEVG